MPAAMERRDHVKLTLELIDSSDVTHLTYFEAEPGKLFRIQVVDREACEVLWRSSMGLGVPNVIRLRPLDAAI